MSYENPRNSGEEWHKKNDYKWMSKDQWECFEMLCDLCLGAHHVGGVVKEWGKGIAVNLKHGFSASTFDFDGLTRAVVLAHDRCIRLEIMPSGPRMIKLVLHKRHSRTGAMHERHPTIDDAITVVRRAYGEPKE